MFMAGADDTPAERNVEDPNAMVNNCVGIPEDPTTVAVAQGTSIAGELLLGMFVARTLHVPDTTHHQRNMDN